MSLMDRNTGRPYRRLPPTVSQVEVDEYADSLERELSEARVEMERRRRITEQELVDQESRRRARITQGEAWRSMGWMVFWAAVGILVVAWWLFGVIQNGFNW
jgi:hypothetical protein